ncbi:MAG: alanine racemase [Aurantimicrobium sp.]|nr:alanine racemase [Aurantimicrobium sp.]
MRVVIDTGAYRRNLAVLRARLDPAQLMAVVKDDAYGHGTPQMVRVARECGISAFAVLDIATGISLRASGVLGNAIAFAWLFDAGDEFGPAIEHEIDLGVSNVEVLDAIAQNVDHDALRSLARVHLKIDTGLHRNGAAPHEWAALIRRAKHWQDEGRIDVVGVWTHIGEASAEDDNTSRNVFDTPLEQGREVGLNPALRHLAASAASFERVDFRYDLARVGGFTYGIGPGSGIGPADLGLEAVMSALASVVRIDDVDGQSVAVLDCGYLDGLPAWQIPHEDRSRETLPQAGFEVVIAGVRCPVLSVGADTMTVALPDAAQPVKAGDAVVVFGSHLRGEPVLQEWADALGTVGEEIVVRVGSRAEREYRES